MRIAVYPGTFDPLTLGHLDLIRRGAALFDQIIVAVAANSTKAGALFGSGERIEMIREELAVDGINNVKVDILDSLLVDYCRRAGVRVVLRGLRAYSDFEHEFQMALANRKLAPEIETLFLMPQEEYSYVTASTVREVVHFGGDTRAFVSPVVQQHIERYMAKTRGPQEAS
ncbi:MAG: pantetheine-phosphate adenylyltransferase [Lentisphaerae bacterium]|jgi:pantetheine-phosphate adenylyltransferase|nr:pantetheine-phosphate adenylyltransferase [Lentisphaerota bacterium]